MSAIFLRGRALRGSHCVTRRDPRCVTRCHSRSVPAPPGELAAGRRLTPRRIDSRMGLAGHPRYARPTANDRRWGRPSGPARGPRNHRAPCGICTGIRIHGTGCRDRHLRVQAHKRTEPHRFAAAAKRRHRRTARQACPVSDRGQLQRRQWHWVEPMMARFDATDLT